MTRSSGADPSRQPLIATWRVVTDPLRASLDEEDVTAADASLAQRRLAALDDQVFEGIVSQMATLEGGTFLRRAMGGSEDPIAFVARVARTATTRTARACMTALEGRARSRFLEAISRAPVEDARRFRKRGDAPSPL